MYVASTSDTAWLLIEQRKLYQRSRTNPDYVFRKLWGLLTSPQNIRVALARVARNKGRRTSGVDGETVRSMLVREDGDSFVLRLRTILRSGALVPRPVRRVLIPKLGQPGKYRALGIPTVTDRVVQAAMKNIMEPIFEADFYPVSYGFRPGKSAHGALQHLKMLLCPRDVGPKAERRLPYQWAIEGDIKGCFDNIDHHALMERVRRRIGDGKVLRLVLAFLKAGILAEEQFLRTDGGTPQGGILSPLLANIALSAIEERYEQHVWPRHTPTRQTDPAAIGKRARDARKRDRRQGKRVFMPIRYADDFIILCAAPIGSSLDEVAAAAAHGEKAALAEDLKNHLGLELSAEKTLVTPVTTPLRFLGHHVRVRVHPSRKRLESVVVIPRARSQRLRERIKDLFQRTTLPSSLETQLRMLNPVLRGWCNFYRHAWGAKRVFARLDHYLWWTIYRWLRKKHPDTPMREIARRYGWRKTAGATLRWKDGETRPFECGKTRVRPFKLGWLKPPAFAIADGEPGA